MIVFVLFLHLAGTACCGSGGVYASEAECRRAGAAWIASVRYRSPNDHFECVRREP